MWLISVSTLTPAPVATPNSITIANLGGNISTSIPATAFAGTNAAPYTLSSLTLTTFPTNATSITINGTTYGNATAFNNATVAARTLTTTANGNLASGQSLSINPSAANAGPASVLPFTVTDVTGATSAAANLTINYGIGITGTVYNEPDGLSEGVFDGTPTGTPGGTQMYVNVLNAAGTTLLGSTAVAANGTYVLGPVEGVGLNTTYTLVLSTSPTSLTATAPAGYGFVAERNGTTGNGDGTPDGRITVATITANIPNVNFGVEIAPIAADDALSALNPGGAGFVVITSSFTGTDADGFVNTFFFPSLPTGIESFRINTTTYTATGAGGTTAFPAAGVLVGASSVNTPRNPGAPIAINPVDGYSVVNIPYFVIDEGGLRSQTVTNVTVTFPLANVATTLTGPGSISAGQATGTYTVTYGNSGVSPAEGVTRTVTLPANSTLTPAQTSAITTQGGTVSGTTISFPVTGGTLPAGATGSSSFTFTFTAPAIVATGLSVTSNISTTTYENGVTADNSASIPLTITQILSGIVFEDVNYGGGAGRPASTAGTSVRPGATVELYSASGAFLATTTTSSTGAYTFPNLAANTNYTVRVVNSTVTSSRNTNNVAGLLPVQTYNGTTDRVGGTYPARQDAAANTSANLSTLTTGSVAAQSIAVVTTGTTVAAGPDFGFNFSTIANTNASGQGSVAQFVLNANALDGEASLAQSGSRRDAANAVQPLPAGRETSIFMIPNGRVVSGLRAFNAANSPGTASQLQGAAASVGGTTALIVPAAALTLSGALTVLDGTTQTQNVGDANSGFVPGATATTVGVQSIALAGIQQPEVELSGSFAGLVTIQATNVTLRGLALHGGSDGGTETVRVGGSGSATGYVLENLVVGSNAAGTRPATNPSNNVGIDLEALAGVGTVRNSFIAFTGNSGINVNNGTGAAGTSQFVANFFRKNGFLSAGGDGISFGDGGGSGLANVENNSFVNTNSSALQFEIGATSVTTVKNNSIQNSGSIGGDAGSVASNLEGAGIVYLQRTGNARGVQADVISLNVITTSQASGIVVGYGQRNVTISQNSFFTNGAGSGAGTLGIDHIGANFSVNTGVPNNAVYGIGDGITLNDGNDATTGPDLPNRGLDFPVVTSATISGTTLVVRGFSRPAITAEFFVRDADANNFGEGQTYLGGGVENGAGDLNTATTTVTYGPGTINGLSQGSDASNQARAFTFSLDISALTPGQLADLTANGITSTATLAGAGTSEFAGRTLVNTAPVANTLTNTATVVTGGPAATLAPGLSGTANGTLSTGSANTIASYTIVSLPVRGGTATASGTLTYLNGTATTTVTAGTSLTAAQLASLAFAPAPGYAGNVTFTYTVTDQNGVTSTTNNNGGTVTAGPATYTIPVTGLALAGTVFNDVNGLSGGIGGTGAGTFGSPAVQTYVSLVSGGTVSGGSVTGGSIVATATVAADGTYSFPASTGAVSANTTSALVLHTTAAGSATAAAPAGYGFIGEGTAAAGDGSPNGLTTVAVLTSSVSGINFGLEFRPTASSTTLTPNNPGGTLQYSIPATAFSGTDTDPNVSSPAGAIASLTITTFPTGATSIVLNGTAYSNAVAFNALPASTRTLLTTANGNLASGQTLTINPSAASAGTATISYQVTDNGGLLSANTGVLTLNFQNSPPVAVNDNATARQNETVVVNAAANDSDPDGTINPATILFPNGLASITVAGQGTFTLLTSGANAGQVQFVPVTGFSGNATVQYTIKDNGSPALASNPATITVNVAGTAFNCNSAFYRVREVGSNSLLERLDRSVTGGVVTYTGVTVLSTATTGVSLNSLAFNYADGYLYAFGTNTTRLYRLSTTGIQDLGLIATLGATNAATSDLNGNMYLANNATTSLRRLNLSTLALTTLTLSQTVTFGDMAYNPVDNKIYANRFFNTAANATNGVAVLTLPASGTAVSVAVLGTPATSGDDVGSMFFDAAGTLYTATNQGNFGIYDLTTGAMTRIASAGAASQSDGASCVFPIEDIDVVLSAAQPVRVDATTFDVTYTVQVKNTGAVTDPNVQLNTFLNDGTNPAGAAFPGATVTVQTAPAVTSGTALALNTGFNGTTSTGLLAGTNSLAANASSTLTYTVRVVYPSVAAIPTTAQNTAVYASTVSAAPNTGYQLINGAAVPPYPVLAGEQSTNSTTLPATAGGDAPGLTPVTFSNPLAANLTNLTLNNTAPAATLSPNLSATPGLNGAGAAIASFTVQPLSSGGTLGVLAYNGVPVTAPITVPDTPAGLALLTFDPTSGTSGSAVFSFTATDALGGVSNVATYTIPVVTVADVTTTLAGPVNLVRGLPSGTYTVAFTNNGPNSAADVTRRVTLPAGITNVFVDGVAVTPVNNVIDFGPAITLVTGYTSATGLFTVVDRAKLPTAGLNITVTITTVDLFGGISVVPFTISLGNAPLPVELTAFTAQAVKNVDAQLNWRTASEKNNAFFDVERSLNGKDFVKFGQVAGQGTTSSATAYALTDAGIGPKASGLVYYRLRQVDLDGTATYSPVRTVAFTKALVASISLYPNPATAGTRLDLSQLPAGAYQVSILDATGRVVIATTLNAGPAHALELSTIASGTYTVLVRGQNGGQLINLTKRLIKE